VQYYEAAGKTVAEGSPDSGLSMIFDELADAVVRLSHDTEGGMRGAVAPFTIEEERR